MAIRIKRKKPNKRRPIPGVPKRDRLAGSGHTSFKQVLRKIFSDSTSKGEILRSKEEMLRVALKRAKKGDFFFWNRLIDLHEADAVSRDDIAEFVERIYLIVRRNVEGLEGGPIALANIAKDLQRDIKHYG